MNKKEKVEAFLKELTELTKKYDLEIRAEGSPLLLYDVEEGEWVAEFGMGFFDSIYKVYQWD
jgi:hypothetical protein